MADYTDIADAELMPDEPIPSLLGFRLRDNPVAIAEGAPDAPKVEGQALGNVRLGRLALTNTTPQAITGISQRAKNLTCFVHTQRTDGAGIARTITIAFSSDGTTYSASLAFASLGAVEAVSGRLSVDLQTGVWDFAGVSTSPNLYATSGTLSLPANVTAIRFTQNTTAITSIIEAYIFGGKTP